MRTKLDEIVEEEYHKDLYWRDVALRIAERAFRHGVEQTSAMIFRPDYLDGYVQPAPAEEKHFCCTIIGEKPCFCRCHPLAPDRRKGQRRKQQWWTYVQVTDEKGCTLSYQNVKYPTVDRRSKDRRKA